MKKSFAYMNVIILCGLLLSNVSLIAHKSDVSTAERIDEQKIENCRNNSGKLWQKMACYTIRFTVFSLVACAMYLIFSSCEEYFSGKPLSKEDERYLHLEAMVYLLLANHCMPDFSDCEDQRSQQDKQQEENINASCA